ncbi:MAG: hypothetical protein ACK56I_18850, partial [bacterium]
AREHDAVPHARGRSAAVREKTLGAQRVARCLVERFAAGPQRPRNRPRPAQPRRDERDERRPRVQPRARDRSARGDRGDPDEGAGPDPNELHLQR